MGLNNFIFQGVFLVMLIFLVWNAESVSHLKVFSVIDYGAKPNGKTDNSKAFWKAWSEACNWKGPSSVWIPQGTFMLNPIIFEGPCKGWMQFVINGVLIAPSQLSSFSDDQWINFRYVDNLEVFGGGKLDGRGSEAWAHNDCVRSSNCQQLPTNIRFDFITNSHVHHLESINSKMVHFVIYGCENMILNKITISAPSDSPNTDGIKISQSNGIRIRNSNIATGDDCIAMISGTRNVRISQVICGPGHGISVGSLGKDEDEEDVEDIVVRNCTFYGTSNGVRIKSWANAMSKPLKASRFAFVDLIMDNVQHPIIIDQQYCGGHSCDNKQENSQVQISNVVYKSIRGSCSGEVSVDLRCSENKPCQNIIMKDITIWPQVKDSGVKLTTLCDNVNGDAYGKQSPPSCL